MKEITTLKGIAKALNISIGTVARAIHGKHDINPETKKMVLDKIAELNYRPNKFARSLSVKNKKKIAVIMPCNSYFWDKVKAGIEFAQHETSYYGIHVKFICFERMDAIIISNCIKELRKEKYDGIILVPAGLQNMDNLNELLGDDLSLCLLNDDMPGVRRQFYVGPDNLLIGNLAGELIGKFLRRKGKCLVISGADFKSKKMAEECMQRIKGFEKAVGSEFPEVESDIFTYGMYVDDAYKTTLDRIKKDDEIVSIYSVDGYLYEVAMAVKESGRKDIILIGHEISDDVNMLLSENYITAAICQNPFLQGYFALTYMVEYLVDRKTPPYDKMFINFNIFTKYNTYGNKNYSSDIGVWNKWMVQ